MDLKKPHAEWLIGRGIDPTLAEKFGLHTMQRGGKNWLAVPYVEHGKTVNHKYRVTSEARSYQMDGGADLVLWNHDILLDRSLDSQPLIITEGEWDALACMMAGKRRVVSVPNGAKDKPLDDEGLVNGSGYSWFWRSEQILRDVQRVLICTDNDDAGHALAADLRRLFGPERCMFVTYPEGCKDAGEVLKGYSADTLREMLDAAKPYPIKGLYEIDDFPEAAKIENYGIGIDPIADMVGVVPGTLTVFTGYANMGKTTVVNSMLAHLIRHNIPVVIASFETEVKPILLNYLRAAVAGRSIQDAESGKCVEADALIRDNVRIISQLADEDQEMDLDYFLTLCRTAVIRDGVRVIVLDPWNELEHKRRKDETETDYIGRALRAIKKFARSYGVAFWIVAHPTKPDQMRKRPPGLYDISGSANWANKADYGLAYHRPNPSENRAEIIVTKVRMGLPGRKGSVFVELDFRSMQFRALQSHGEAA